MAAGGSVGKFPPWCETVPPSADFLWAIGALLQRRPLAACMVGGYIARAMDTSKENRSAVPHRSLGKRLGRLAVLAVSSYVFVLAAMMLLENWLIFFPLKYPAGNWQPQNIAVEDADFQADGLKLHGWFIEAAEPRAVVLLAHGKGGNVTQRVDFLQRFRSLGTSVLVFDYRGYGRSEGSPSEAGVLADARAARCWLAERAGVPEKQIVLCGESLGGGVVVDLAASDGARGLILLNTFDSITTVAALRYPWAPVKWLMRTRLDSAAKIAKYPGPLLQIHGSADSSVPLALAQRLFAAAGEPKELVVIENGGHNDPLGPVALRAIDRFLDELPGQDEAQDR